MVGIYTPMVVELGDMPVGASRKADVEPSADGRPAFLTPEELAAFLKVPPRWVEKQTQARRLPGQTKVGRYWRYRRADIEKQILTGEILLPKLPRGRLR